MRRTTDRPNIGRHAVLVPLVALAVLAGAAGCGEGGTEVGTAATAPSTTGAPLPPIEGDARQQLEAARARWAAAGIDSYELAWSWVCFCPRLTGWSRVVDGEVVDGGVQTAGSPGTEQVVDDGGAAEAGDDPAAAPTTATIPGTAPGSIPGTTLPPDWAPSTVPPDPATSKLGDPGAIPPGVPETTIPSGTETGPTEGPSVSISDPDTPPLRITRQLTVEGIFDEIEHALDEGADEVVVDYDPDTGRPRQIDIDWITNAIDDEMGIRIDRFEILEGDVDPGSSTPDPSITGTSLAPAIQSVATADLSAAHGCGYGFYVGDREQTVALHLDWRPDLGPTAGMPAGPEDGPITLPDPDWQGELQIGADLFANWCDDVLGFDEPTPEIAERWLVVGGVLEVTTPPTTSGCGSGRPVEATVTDLEVEAPDGSVVGLPALELVNDSWGCIPG